MLVNPDNYNNYGFVTQIEQNHFGSEVHNYTVDFFRKAQQQVDYYLTAKEESGLCLVRDKGVANQAAVEFLVEGFAGYLGAIVRALPVADINSLKEICRKYEFVQTIFSLLKASYERSFESPKLELMNPTKNIGILISENSDTIYGVPVSLYLSFSKHFQIEVRSSKEKFVFGLVSFVEGKTLKAIIHTERLNVAPDRRQVLLLIGKIVSDVFFNHDAICRSIVTPGSYSTELLATCLIRPDQVEKSNCKCTDIVEYFVSKPKLYFGMITQKFLSCPL